MKVLLTLCGLVLAGGILGCVVPSVADVVEDAKASVVQVETDKTLATGFILAGGRIMTNRHVVAQAEWLIVRFPNGAVYPAQVDQIVTDQDIVILTIETTDEIPWLPLARSADVGEDVIALSYPQGSREIVVTTGVISAIQTIAAAKFIQTDTALNVGSSGGPLLNRAGEVLGMITFKLPDVEGAGYAVCLPCYIKESS